MSTKQPHIVFLCSRLDLPGGIERAIINTANLLASNNHKVTLAITEEAPLFYPLDNRVKIVERPLSFGISTLGNVMSRKIMFAKDLLFLRRWMKELKAEVVIGTEYHLTASAALCLKGLNIRVMGWEHHHFHELKPNLFWSMMVKTGYKKLDALVCLNPDEQKLYSALSTNTVVIPNFTTDAVNPGSEKMPLILTVGRLCPVKGMDRLLQVARIVLEKHPGWTWKVIGSGEQEEAMKRFIVEHHLEQRLILQQPAGHDLAAEYAKASLYVMTSRNECFPMTLLEAMHSGLPCIAFDCPTGPRNIIAHQQDGLLIEEGNIEAMAVAIDKLVSQPELRNEMSQAVKAGIQRYSASSVYPLWKDLLLK